jgi:hypothetical protein
MKVRLVLWAVYFEIMSIDSACPSAWSFRPDASFYLPVFAFQTALPPDHSSNVLIISLEGRPINCCCDPYAFFVR